jgi:phage shock protein E
MDWTIAIIAGGVIVAFFTLKRMSFVSVEAALRHLAGGAVVIDVRTPEEFRSGHVAEALNIPLGELKATLPIHVSDKNKVLLVHCLSGGRSAVARQQLRAMGYLNTFNLGGVARARSIAGKTPAA